MQCPYCGEAGSCELTDEYGVDRKAECVDCWTYDTGTWRELKSGCKHCGGTMAPTYLLPHYDHEKPLNTPSNRLAWYTDTETVEKILEGPPNQGGRYRRNVVQNRQPKQSPPPKKSVATTLFNKLFSGNVGKSIKQGWEDGKQKS